MKIIENSSKKSPKNRFKFSQPYFFLYTPKLFCKKFFHQHSYIFTNHKYNSQSSNYINKNIFFSLDLKKNLPIFILILYVIKNSNRALSATSPAHPTSGRHSHASRSCRQRLAIIRVDIRRIPVIQVRTSTRRRML